MGLFIGLFLECLFGYFWGILGAIYWAISGVFMGLLLDFIWAIYWAILGVFIELEQSVQPRLRAVFS